MLLAMLGVAAVLSAREASGGAALVAADRDQGLGRLRRPLRPPRHARAATRLASAGARLGGGSRRWRSRSARPTSPSAGTGCDALRPRRREPGPDQLHEHPDHLARLTGLDPDAVRIAALVLFAAAVAYLLTWTWRGGDWIRAAAWAAFALLLATAWLLPWYLIWALPSRRPSPATARCSYLDALRAHRLPAGRAPASPSEAQAARTSLEACSLRLFLLRRGMEDPGVDAPALAPPERGDGADVDQFDHRQHAAHGDRDQRAEREALLGSAAFTAQAKAASRTPRPAGATSVTSAAK